VRGLGGLALDRAMPVALTSHAAYLQFRDGIRASDLRADRMSSLSLKPPTFGSCVQPKEVMWH